MWNPTPSSSTASSSDNKQNIREQIEVDDCKCSGGGIEQLNQQQKKSNNSKHKCILPERQGEAENYDNKLSDLSGETIDSGFISGPQTSSSAYFENDNEDKSGGGETKLLNTPESTEHQQKEQYCDLNLDSGIIEEDFEGDDCNLQEQNQSSAHSIEQTPKMLLPNSVESGISEWFCNLSLHNNPNAANINTTLSSASNSLTNPSMTIAGTGLNNLGAPKQQQTINKSSVSAPSASVGLTAQQTATISQQITPTNAWEKFYQQDDDGDT